MSRKRSRRSSRRRGYIYSDFYGGICVGAASMALMLIVELKILKG